MPTRINDKLISWASRDRRPGHRPGREDGTSADRRGPRRPHARCPRRHRGDRRLGHPDQERRDPRCRRRRHRLRHGRCRARRHRAPAALTRSCRCSAASSGPSRPVSATATAVPPRTPGAGWPRTSRPPSWLPTVSTRRRKQFGTLGSGNHFFELCVDERARVWVVLHSGSRGIGNQLAQAHIAKARGLAEDLELRLEDPDLAYFVEGTPEFQAYIGDMLWAQDYARANRDQMMDNAMREVFAFLGFGRETRRINCHHNFTQREVHGGQELWITRKGAIKADTGDLGVIPGSMGTRSYIVAGQGQCRQLDVVLARRRPPVQPDGRPRSSSPRRTSRTRWWARSGSPRRASGALGRDPGRLQGHRPGDGRPVGPGRGPAHAASGPQLQGDLRQQGEPRPERAGRGALRKRIHIRGSPCHTKISVLQQVT